MAGLDADDADPFELAAAQLDLMEGLAQECSVLSTTLVSSLADILWAKVRTQSHERCFRTEVPLDVRMCTSVCV